MDKFANLTESENQMVAALRHGQSYGSAHVLKLLETISELRGQQKPQTPLDAAATILEAFDSLVAPDIR